MAKYSNWETFLISTIQTLTILYIAAINFEAADFTVAIKTTQTWVGRGKLFLKYIQNMPYIVLVIKNKLLQKEREKGRDVGE